jgi:hypothetical protein
MRLLSVSLALLFAVAVVANVSADDDGKGKGKGKKGLVHGRVEAVKKDADKDSGIIEVELHHKKGQAAGTEKKEKFKVTPDTKFEFIHREGKGDVDRKPATFADVHKGERVLILPMEGAKEVAQRVEIVVGKKGKVKKTVNN